MSDRAILFIDGNNWYHALRDIRLDNIGRLNYEKISRKLIGPREWSGTRYYIGQVRQQANTQLYADQRRFLSRLEQTDSKISIHLGRLEPRRAFNPAAEQFARYLADLKVRIDASVYRDLVNIANEHKRLEVYVEKAVDVMIAVDMVLMAARNEYDAAYLLSADGDFTPAVEAVAGFGKKVYSVSPNYGAQLAGVSNSFIRPGSDWFLDCL